MEELAFGMRARRFGGCGWCRCRAAVHVPPEKEPTPIKYDSSSEQMWRRPLGAPAPLPPTPPGPFPGWDGLDRARGKTCRLLAALLLAEFALTKLQLCFAFRPAWVSEKGAGFFWVGKNIPFFLWGRWYLCFSEKKFLDNNILLYALDVWDKRTIFKQSVSLLKCCQKGQEGIQPRRNLFQI